MRRKGKERDYNDTVEYTNRAIVIIVDKDFFVIHAEGDDTPVIYGRGEVDRIDFKVHPTSVDIMIKDWEGDTEFYTVDTWDFDGEELEEIINVLDSLEAVIYAKHGPVKNVGGLVDTASSLLSYMAYCLS